VVERARAIYREFFWIPDEHDLDREALRGVLEWYESANPRGLPAWSDAKEDSR
jgi:hypothetical protein